MAHSEYFSGGTVILHIDADEDNGLAFFSNGVLWSIIDEPSEEEAAVWRPIIIM